jgi:hypothetical protein
MSAVGAGPDTLGEFPIWADHRQVDVVDPVTGLTFVELSHTWGTHTPVYPGYKDIQIRRAVTHASHGVMSQHIVTVMHNGTHVNAPVHLVQGGAGVGDLDLERFFVLCRRPHRTNYADAVTMPTRWSGCPRGTGVGGPLKRASGRSVGIVIRGCRGRRARRRWAGSGRARRWRA